MDHPDPPALPYDSMQTAELTNYLYKTHGRY